MLGTIDIIISVMKITTNHKTNEITFHTNVSEMIDYCFTYLRACVESQYNTTQKQLGGIEHYMQVINTLKSGNIDAIIKLFKNGEGSTIVPGLIGDWDGDKKLRVSITLDSGIILIINHDNIEF